MHPWVVYIFQPGMFACLRCGAKSLFALPEDIKDLIVQFRRWAPSHFECVHYSNTTLDL